MTIQFLIASTYTAPLRCPTTHLVFKYLFTLVPAESSPKGLCQPLGLTSLYVCPSMLLDIKESTPLLLLHAGTLGTISKAPSLCAHHTAISFLGLAISPGSTSEVVPICFQILQTYLDISGSFLLLQFGLGKGAGLRVPQWQISDGYQFFDIPLLKSKIYVPYS